MKKPSPNTAIAIPPISSPEAMFPHARVRSTARFYQTTRSRAIAQNSSAR
jgi:hypothetical protein